MGFQCIGSYRGTIPACSTEEHKQVLRIVLDFIHCSECQRSICGKRSFTRSDGNRWFSCYPKCGCSGLISVECIESLSGTKIELSDTSAEPSGSATVRNRSPQSTSSLDKTRQEYSLEKLQILIFASDRDVSV